MPWKVIEFQDGAGDVLVARVPEEGTAELVSGTQLIVQDGQIAAFFHDGRPTDGFLAGRHSLSTQNLPVLGKLLNLASLGPSPFRSYVYFIHLKIFTGLGWGTATPVLFRDSVFQMVPIRAHGAFSIRVSGPKAFLKTIVGTQGLGTTYAIEEYLRNIIVSRFNQTLPEVMTSVVDLAVHYEKIAALVKSKVHDAFDQYGLELVDLIVEAITLPPEVQDSINRAAGARAVGMDELRRYETLARSDALRDAAKQPGGVAAAGLTAGLGIGAGSDIARQTLNSSAATGASSRLSVDEVKGKLKELKELVDEGLITQEDFDAQKKRLLGQI